jgi:hypothetical protein
MALIGEREKLKSLKAYLSEAADSYLAGQGDELSALAESVVPEKGLIDRPSFDERFGRNLERRREARKQLQDENIVAGGLGGLTGALSSPMARVAFLPARMVTSAAEEVGRSDPEGLLETLKALGVGAGQGALQQVAPGIAGAVRKRSAFRKLPQFLDVFQSNAAPGFDRFREEQERKKLKE